MFEMDSDGVSVFVQDGYEDVYDYCMNYRNDSYVKKEFDFVAYVEDDKLSVGIKSDTEFEGSEDLGDNAYTKYMTFSPREEGFFPEYNNLRITWGDDTNSWNVETNSGFSMLDIRIHQAWEEEENETSNIESIINKFVTSLETQRNFNAEVFFLIKSELSKSLDKNFVINKIKNIGEDIFSAVRCELVGTKLFCYESFLYDGVNVDFNTSSAEFEILHTGEIKFFNWEGEFMFRAEIDSNDFFGFGEYIIKRFTNDWKSTTPAELSQFFDELSKDYQFDKNDENFLGFINIDTETDKSDDYTVMQYIIHNKSEAEKYANKYGLTIESAQEGELIVNLLNNDLSQIDIYGGFEAVGRDYTEQIIWLKAFIIEWDNLDNDINSDTKQEKLTKIFSVFCNANMLPKMSADELLLELEDKRQWLGGININDKIYATKLIQDEDNENKYLLEFYENVENEFGSASKFVGDCELIYDERTNSIESLDWTLPEYAFIDPNDELYENEDVFEMITNISLRDK
jgi:hypothetical protein